MSSVHSGAVQPRCSNDSNPPFSFRLDRPGRFGYFEPVKYLYRCAAFVLVAALAPSPLSGQSGGDRLILVGDLVYFYPPGHPRNCLLNNQFKRGEPVGFRMNALNPATGKRDRATELVVHLTYAGKTVDVPMRWRGVGGFPASEYSRQPSEMWTGVWVVPADAPIGAITYTVTAMDRFGRTASFSPFINAASQLTIVE